MFYKLLFLFMAVPIVELALLIKIGSYIGIIYTIILVGLTGVIGVSLARQQGFQIISRIKQSLNQGQMPADDLIGGLLILSGGIMLLTPGLLTDITGFTFIIPASRQFLVKLLKRKFQGYIKDNFKYQNLNFDQNSDSRNYETREEEEDIIDIDKNNES